MATSRPNFLVIMTDQHRADVLGCAGDPIVQTPSIDGLAREGVRFSRAYCQGPLCMPARASFVSEKYVHEHGVANNLHQLGADTPTFTRALQMAGYHTACIGKMHLYVQKGAKDTRLHRGVLSSLGFTEALETTGKLNVAKVRSPYTDYLSDLGIQEAFFDWISTYSSKEVPAWKVETFPFPKSAYIDSWIGSQAVTWIEQYSKSAPFFQWIGFAGPHDPWDAPAEYVERYDQVSMPVRSRVPPTLPQDGRGRQFLNACLEESDAQSLDPEKVQRIQRSYYANVTLIDEQIGLILAALRRRGLLDNTWIIYTSDHGGMLGDHGLLNRKVFYEPAVSIPLVIRDPRRSHSKTFPGLVQQIDVGATIRDVGQAEHAATDGVSLASLFDEDWQSYSSRETVLSENLGFGMVSTKERKLVFDMENLEPIQMFDLTSDPEENINLLDRPDPSVISERDAFLERHVRPFYR